MPSTIFRVVLGLMLVGAACAAAYIHYFRPPIGCTDEKVVDTARRIVKERLLDGTATDVTLHLITTSATARDGVRCTASAQIQMGIGKDDQYRDIEYMAFVGKDYFSGSGDKKGFIVFANFKR